MGLLIAAALLAGLIGLFMLSNATLGVGVIAFGCLLAILARISQAADQHRELKTLLDRLDGRSTS